MNTYFIRYNPVGRGGECAVIITLDEEDGINFKAFENGIEKFNGDLVNCFVIISKLN